VLVQHQAAGGQHGHLALLGHLPVDEGLDVRVVQVQAHHLGRPAGGAAGLDGARRPVPHRQEGHEPGGAATAGQRLLGAPHLGEIGAGPAAVLEDAGFPGPQVHDPARVHQIVLDALDEAGMRLGALVGGGGTLQLAGLRVDEAVALGRAGDAVGEVQAGVEPLRAVGRAHLVGQHVHEFVIEDLGILGVIEVAVPLAPVAPAPGQPVEHLAGVVLAAASQVDALAAEILLGQDVHRHLGPAFRHHHVLQLEHDGAVQLRDPAGAGDEGDARERVAAGFGKEAGYLHGSLKKTMATVAWRHNTPYALCLSPGRLWVVLE
jgi:hypothetical protein